MGDLKLAGINSGFDTESMIQKMMSAYQTKIDNQNKKLTMLSWQQEAYRDVISKLTAFQTKYFNISNLSKGSYLLSPTNFSKLKTTITNKLNPDSTFSGIKVITGQNTQLGSHSLKVSQTASAAKLTGVSVAPANFNLDLEQAAKGSSYEEITNDDGDVIGRKYNFSLDVKVGESSRTIDFSVEVSETDGEIDMDEFASAAEAALNQKLADEFGMTGRTTAKNNVTGAVDENGNEYALQVKLRKDSNGTYLDFEVGGNVNVTVTEKEGSFGLTRPAYRTMVNMMSSVTGKNSVAININGATRYVSFDGVSSTYFDSRSDEGNEDILEEFNELKEAAYRKKMGLSDSDEVTEDDLKMFSYSSAQAAEDKNTAAFEKALNLAYSDKGYTFDIDESGFLSVTDSDGTALQFTISSTAGGTLGLVKDSATNRFVPGSSLADMGLTTPEGEISFKINGKEIKLSGSATMDDLVNAVNNSGAGVTMSYSKLENRFTITANEMGAAGKIDIEDESGVAAQLGLVGGNFEAGKNAIFELDGVELVNSDNTYTLEDGTVIDMTDAVLDTEFNIGIDHDYTDIKQAIKDFVNDYNQLIDDIYGYTSTARSKDSKGNYYDPLTDEQKAEMSEKEIENWETMAKKGVLYNDSTINLMLSQIRSAMYGSIKLDDGSNFGLFNMGITTASSRTAYEDSMRGKLVLDEDKLDAAFETHADDITKLFTDPEVSVMRRIDNILDRAVNTSGDLKGSLVRKAGIEGTTSAKDNAIYRQMESIQKRIKTLQDRYDSKEKYWWNVFTRLEKMMADFNSQAAYMTNLFSSFDTTNSSQ